MKSSMFQNMYLNLVWLGKTTLHIHVFSLPEILQDKHNILWHHTLYTRQCQAACVITIALILKSGSVHVYFIYCQLLNEVDGKEQYCVESLNRFAALEKLDIEVDINRVWETIRENIKISNKQSLDYYELKKHKSWFDDAQNY
jgi:hypothetical protein